MYTSPQGSTKWYFDSPTQCITIWHQSLHLLSLINRHHLQHELLHRNTQLNLQCCSLLTIKFLIALQHAKMEEDLGVFITWVMSLSTQVDSEGRSHREKERFWSLLLQHNATTESDHMARYVKCLNVNITQITAHVCSIISMNKHPVLASSGFGWSKSRHLTSPFKQNLV